MLSIKEKLRELEQTPSFGRVQTSVPESSGNFEKFGLQKCSNDFGDVVIREKRYPLNFKHGDIEIVNFLNISNKHLEFIHKNTISPDVRAKDWLFFDSETTGLAGGSGTLVFLCGFGYFESNEFVVRQLLLDSPRNELAYLSEIKQMLTNFAGIISFNGKSFDLPLLQTRFILSKMDFQLDHFVHLDLLHAARRLWGPTLPDCSLGTIENKRLRFLRHNDVSGAKVPKLYFDYLKSADYQLLLPVLKHNVIDILSMVSIVSLMSMAFEKTDAGDIPQGIDEIGVLKSFISLDEFDRILQYCKSDFTGMSINALNEIAFYLKRKGRIEQAIFIWEHLITRSEFSETAYLELAKYYEHFARNYSDALSVVQRVAKRIEIREELGRDSNALVDDWKHREKRLLRKIASSNLN